MLKEIKPTLTVLIAVLFDSAILPVFYTGKFVIMLSLIVIIMIAIMRGRIRGMVYGMIAGLLLDISAGTLGMKLAAFIAIGFIVGFLLDGQSDIYSNSVNLSRKDRIQYLFVRLIWISILLVIYEIVMLLLQYWSNAVFEWSYVRDIFIRTLASDFLIFALSPMFHALYIGRGDAERAKGRKTREVKNY